MWAGPTPFTQQKLLNFMYNIFLQAGIILLQLPPRTLLRTTFHTSPRITIVTTNTSSEAQGYSKSWPTHKTYPSEHLPWGFSWTFRAIGYQGLGGRSSLSRRKHKEVILRTVIKLKVNMILITLHYNANGVFDTVTLTNIFCLSSKKLLKIIILKWIPWKYFILQGS